MATFARKLALEPLVSRIAAAIGQVDGVSTAHLRAAIVCLIDLHAHKLGLPNGPAVLSLSDADLDALAGRTARALCEVL